MVGAMKPGGSLQPNGQRIQEPVMPVEHVADAVVHMASLSLNVNILNQVREPFQLSSFSKLTLSHFADHHGDDNAVRRPRLVAWSDLSYLSAVWWCRDVWSSQYCDIGARRRILTASPTCHTSAPPSKLFVSCSRASQAS